MGKKKAGGKKGGGGGKKGGPSPLAPNAVIELPPPREQMSLLYRKASFDVLPARSTFGALAVQEGDAAVVPLAAAQPPRDKLILFQQDLTHRAVVPAYCEFLRQRKFWMTGDPVPDGAVPRVPAPPKAKGGGGKKKKK